MPNLVQKVAAQAGPTFPYDGPFDQPGPTPPDEQVVVRLSADSSTVAVGGTVTADLSIESNAEEIQEYTVTIIFDPAVLEVVDSDTVQSGIQISFLDTFANEQTNTADNTTGTITLQASISGAAQTINKGIGAITFRAKTTGASVVSINKAQSSVTNDQGTDVLETTTSINLTVSGQAVTTTTTQTTTIDGLPPSGIFNTLATLFSVLSGFLLLFVGMRTIIDKKRGKGLEL